MSKLVLYELLCPLNEVAESNLFAGGGLTDRQS